MSARVLIIGACAFLLTITNRPEIWTNAQPDEGMGESSDAAESPAASDSRDTSEPELITNYRPIRTSSNPSMRTASLSRRINKQSSSSQRLSRYLPRSQLHATNVRSRTADIGREHSPTLMPLPDILKDIMNLRVEPCENFHKFATGRKPFIDRVSFDKEIRNVLANLISGEASTSSENIPGDFLGKNIRSLYRSCMRKVHESIHENLKSFLSLMADLGSCPLLQEELGWDIRQGDSNLRFVTGMLRLFKMGLMKRQPISLDVVPDPEDPSRPILHIGQPKENMYFDANKNSISVAERLKLLRMQLSLDPEPGPELVEPVHLNMIEYVKAFAIGLSEARTEVPGTKKVKLEKFAKDHPYIDWTHLVRDLTGQSGNSYVLISNEKYLSRLGELIHTSSYDLIPNYIFMTFFVAFERFLSIGQEFNKVTCFKIVERQMDLPLSIELRRSLDPAVWSQTLIEVNNLAENIRARLEESLKRAIWMTTDSRDYALEKLKEMKFFIALTKSDELEWDVNLAQEQFGGYQLQENSGFIQNYLIVCGKKGSFALAQLRRPTRNAAEWAGLGLKPSSSFNYVKEANAIEIPIKLLRPPYFDVHQADYLNFGSLGFTIAMNIMRAFDLGGSTYNSKGVYSGNMYDQRTRNLFSRATRNFFLHRSITYDEANSTLQSDMIILGAARITLAAYEVQLSRPTYRSDMGSQLENGQTLGPKQLLLVTMAANMDHILEQVRDGTRSELRALGSERVNQIFRFVTKFGHLFECQVGSFMKPVANLELHIW